MIRANMDLYFGGFTTTKDLYDSALFMEVLK